MRKGGVAHRPKAQLAKHGSGAEGLKSLRKAMRVPDCFSLKESQLPLTDIACKVRLSLSTAHRILATLRDVGIVWQEGKRDLYRLGLKLLELGSMVLANMEVHRKRAGNYHGGGLS
jgi:DNA-binding IclR family transcriptional regulator